MTGIPADVAFQAARSCTAAPEPPPGSGATRVTDPRFTVLMTPMPTVSFVEPILWEPDISGLLEAVRDVLRGHGRSQGAWLITDTEVATLDALAALGMEPYTDAPLEPLFTCLALVRPPEGEPPTDVEIREATELADFEQIADIASEVFGIAGADRDALLASLRHRYDLVRSGESTTSNYLAYLDGELVGEAQGTAMAAGINLSGASVVARARGRGVYRALVAARWKQAVDLGLPALTVQAGEMSRPILEKLGFEVVERQRALRDRF